MKIMATNQTARPAKKMLVAAFFLLLLACASSAANWTLLVSSVTVTYTPGGSSSAGPMRIVPGSPSSDTVQCIVGAADKANEGAYADFTVIKPGGAKLPLGRGTLERGEWRSPAFSLDGSGGWSCAVATGDSEGNAAASAYSFTVGTPTPLPQGPEKLPELRIDAFPLRGNLLVKDAGGKPVAGARIAVMLPSGERVDYVTLDDGVVVLPAGGGKYSTAAEKEGYLPAEKSFYSPSRETGFFTLSPAGKTSFSIAALLLCVAAYAYREGKRKTEAAEKRSERRRIGKLKLRLKDIFRKN